MKTIVLYCFHEYNHRVKQFIETGIFKDPNVDFMMIINNPTTKIHTPSYVKIMNRENMGYDFGAWSDAVLTFDLVHKYDKFIFLNSSVTGPYVYTREKWTDLFLNGLEGNIKLYGCTINAMKDPIHRSHVQSYLFCMDKKTLSFLIQKGIFSKTYVKTFRDAIIYKEVLMSRLILNHGWNIGSRLPYYKDVDFTFNTKKISDYPVFLGDVMNNTFYNKLWTKEQLIFLKGNRIKCTKKCKRIYSPRVPKSIKIPNYLKQ
jgi:hypothetical protein